MGRLLFWITRRLGNTIDRLNSTLYSLLSNLYVNKLGETTLVTVHKHI